MMRFILVFLLMLVGTWGACYFTPWWSLMPIAFVLTLLFPMKLFKAMSAAGLGAVGCYLFIVLNADISNEHILSTRMAHLFKMPSFAIMIIITVLIGFLTAAVGAWLAIVTRQLFITDNVVQEEA